MPTVLLLFCSVRRLCALLVLLTTVALTWHVYHAPASHPHRTGELIAGSVVAVLTAAYLAFDVYLDFADQSIRSEIALANEKTMYNAIPHLQSAARVALQKGALFRVYNESLIACWPGLPEDIRADRIAKFAAQNRWVVNFRQVGALGLVAEFEKDGHQS